MKQMKKIKENLKKQKDKLQKIMSDLEKHIKKFDTRKSGKWKSLKQKISPGIAEARNYSNTL
jgi:ElaB/YqjD/DUF883 family membrane-anchored ribosome-binding protein